MFSPVIRFSLCTLLCLLFAPVGKGWGQKPIEDFSFTPAVGVPLAFSPREQPVGGVGLTARYHPHDAYAVGLSYQRTFSRYAQRQGSDAFAIQIQRSLVTMTHDYYLGKSRVRPLVGWAFGVSGTQLNFERREAGADTAGRTGYGGFVVLLPKLGVLLRPSERLSVEVTGSLHRLFTPGGDQTVSESAVKELEGRYFLPTRYLVSIQAALRWTIHVKY